MLNYSFLKVSLISYEINNSNGFRYFSKFYLQIYLITVFIFSVEYAKNVKYTDLQRPVIEEDIVKAIKFKLNNEEQAFKKQHEEQPKSVKE